LTAVDVREQRKVFGLREGIPLADDLDRGVYFATADDAVMFRAPGPGARDVEVAKRAADLLSFEVHE